MNTGVDGISRKLMKMMKMKYFALYTFKTFHSLQHSLNMI